MNSSVLLSACSVLLFAQPGFGAAAPAVRAMELSVCPRVVPPKEGDPQPFKDAVRGLFADRRADWAFVAQHIDQYKFFSTAVSWMHKRDPALLAMAVQSINRLGLGIAVEVGIENGAGFVIDNVLDPIAKDGGRVDFIAIDNAFVKAFKASRAPRPQTLNDTVEKCSSFVAEVKRAYPRLRVGMIEAAFAYYWEDVEKHPAQIAPRHRGDLKIILNDTLAACRKKGTALDFYQMEYSYSRVLAAKNGWETIREIEGFCRSNQIGFGVLYEDHEGGGLSDEAFCAKTLEFQRELAGRGIRPDLGTLQSWFPHPERVLGEDEPYSFMYCARRLIEQMTQP